MAWLCCACFALVFLELEVELEVELDSVLGDRDVRLVRLGCFLGFKSWET